MDNRRRIDQELYRLRSTGLGLDNAEILRTQGLLGVNGSETLDKLLRRPGMSYEQLATWLDWSEPMPPDIAEQIEIELIYEGYINRQKKEVERLRHLEHRVIPSLFDYESLVGLSAEAKEKFTSIAPRTIGQAARISGVTPAAISILLIALSGEQRRHALSGQQTRDRDGLPQTREETTSPTFRNNTIQP